MFSLFVLKAHVLSDIGLIVHFRQQHVVVIKLILAQYLHSVMQVPRDTVRGHLPFTESPSHHILTSPELVRALVACHLSYHLVGHPSQAPNQVSARGELQLQVTTAPNVQATSDITTYRLSR